MSVDVAQRQSDPLRPSQHSLHIYDEVPREDPSEETVPTLPPKTTRSSSDKKNNNDDNSPVNLALDKEEELLLLRKKKYVEFMNLKSAAQNSHHRGIARHESAPPRNGYQYVKYRVKPTLTLQDNKPNHDPHYQDPDDFKDDISLKSQSSMPCIPLESEYEQHRSLGFNCDNDDGIYWQIPRDTFCSSGDYAEWPAIGPHSEFPGKPYAQSTLKKQMSTSTSSSSRTDSSMVDIKTYEDSISSAAESPVLPKKFRPIPKSRRSLSQRRMMQEREIQVNSRELYQRNENATTQTEREVKECCSCGDMVYVSDDAMHLRDMLKMEQSQRLMAEQLFKLAEREVIDLQSEINAEKTIAETLSRDLVTTKDKLTDVDRLAAEQRTRSQDLQGKLNDANNRITKLEEEISETNQQKQEVQKMLDTKLAQLRMKTADSQSRMEMLQADLLQSQQEINRLLERLADVNREKSEMVSNEVHSELLRMADERAKRAEMKAMALEHELRQLRHLQFNNSHDHGIPPAPPVKVLPDKKDIKHTKPLPDRPHEYPPTLPPRGGFDYTQANPNNYGNRPRNASSPASPHLFRKNNECDNDDDRSRTMHRNKEKRAKEKMRSQSKSPKRSARITTKMNRVHSQGGVDNKNKITLLSRVQSKMEPKAQKSPKSTHKTFLDRVQSKFFASKKKDAVTPCDLPDINTLMQYAVKAEYETPLEYMKNYTGTPLINNENNTVNNKTVAESDSDWSETDDEFLEPGVKKVKRDKAQHKYGKNKDKAKAGKDAQKAKSKDGESKKEESKEETDQEGGSQKSKSGKPPPVAPKPKKSSINNTSTSSLNSTGSQTKTNSTDATSQDKLESTESLDDTKTPPSPVVAPSSPGREAPISFEESAPEKPQLKSYRRAQGPQGRRRPQRYSSQAMSQTMSTTLSQIMA